METKICNKCKEEKFVSEFHKDRGKRDGLRTICKLCTKQYYKDNAPAIRKQKRQYYKDNAPALKQKRKDNAPVINERNRSYYWKNAPTIRSRKYVYRREFAKYDTHKDKLKQYDIECRRAPDDKELIEVCCFYSGCSEWFKPTNVQIHAKMKSIYHAGQGESNLYCSDQCKSDCPTYYRNWYKKGEAPKQSEPREDQAEFRQILIEERGTTCEKCGIDVPKGIICHHIHPVKLEPLLSLDKDNALLLCYECDQKCHQIEGCKTGQLAHTKVGESC